MQATSGKVVQMATKGADEYIETFDEICGREIPVEKTGTKPCCSEDKTRACYL